MNLLTAARRRLGRLKRQLRSRRLCAKFEEKEILRFTCNICGHSAAYPEKLITREGNSCAWCGSTVRLRSLIRALSLELFGQSLQIADFPERRDLSGIGLSDWEGYALRLPEKLNYTNTFYHQAPLLDITSDDAPAFGQFDFILCSDVFEHIAPPVEKAFRNARLLLKPGGVMIFSVPLLPGETKEHFPELCDWKLVRQGSEWALTNTTADGRQQHFTNLTFHGGPGTVIEMRIFGDDSLRTNFSDAGFVSQVVHSQEDRQLGIVWNPYRPEDSPYRPLIFGLDSPPWAVRAAPTEPG